MSKHLVLTFFVVASSYLHAENGKDKIATSKNSVKPEEETNECRNIGPSTDEEAYAPDKEAFDPRNN